MVNSLYIPIIGTSITEDFIKEAFLKKSIGNVARVDFVFNKIKKRREAFIHFNSLFKNESVKVFMQDIENPFSQAKFYYTEDKYWPCYINKNPNNNKVSNEKYLIEEDIKDIREKIDKLVMITKMQDSHIKYILHQNGHIRVPEAKKSKAMPTIESINEN